jgi:hypothetical protein
LCKRCAAAVISLSLPDGTDIMSTAVIAEPFLGGSDQGGRPGASTKQKEYPQVLLRHLLLVNN